MDFKSEYKKRIDYIDKHIENYLNSLSGIDKTLKDALKYSVLNGGKRIRSILLMECAKLFGKDYEDTANFAMAIEFIHAYSLVHDDLPAMDNSDYRRGQLSCHKKYGETLAILTGDSLLNLAFEVLFKECIKGEKEVLASQKISTASGVFGMINGQVEDINISSKKDATEDELISLIEQKTMALIGAAAVSGAILGGADDEDVKLIDNYSYHLGLAFQIRDDIEDEEEDAFEQNDCPNFLNVLGKDKAIDRLNYHKDKSNEYLKCFENNEFLNELNTYLFN